MMYWCDNCEKQQVVVELYYRVCCEKCGKVLLDLTCSDIYPSGGIELNCHTTKGMFDESPQPALWTTFSSCYNDDVNVDYIEDELQFKYSSIYNDDLHEEDEEKEDEDEDEDEEYEEASQKIMSEIEHLSCKNLDCKHVDGVERLVRVYADLQRKDKELELLRAELNLAIKELQAIIHKWHTKYLHAKSVLRLNGIPFADP